jgi:hypothetical protein
LSRRVALVGCCAFASLTASAAWSADWSLTALWSETALYQNNPGLSPVSAMPMAGLQNNLGFALTAAGKRSNLAIDANFNYPFYAGPGAPTPAFHSSAAAKFDTHTRLSSFSASASMSQANTTTTELLDSGLVSINAVRTRKAVGADYSHQINALNSVSLSANATFTSFTGETGPLVGSRSFNAAGSWSHRLTGLTDVNATVSYNRFVPTDPVKPVRDIYRASAGFNSKLTRRLSVSGSAGVRFINPSSGLSTTGTFGSLDLSYATKRTTFALSASRSAAPNSVGEIQLSR